MNRKRVFAIAAAVLVAGAALAFVVLRGGGDDFAAELERRPKCWVKVKSSVPGTCPGGVGQVHQGACYVPNWSECAKYY